MCHNLVTVFSGFFSSRSDELAMKPAKFKWIATSAFLFAAIGSGQIASAVLFSFDSGDFVTDPQFGNVTTFHFEIDVNQPIIPGGVYDNPELNSVVYNVIGSLQAETPSGFPSFNLARDIRGSAFYAQGSSLNFKIVASANLTDGLQMSELEGSGSVFVFDGREVDTGRYHPSLFELNVGESGSIQNSNNMGGINPGSNEEVNVQIGEEYITELMFSPSLTIAPAIVPEPSALVLISSMSLGIFCRRRR